MKSIFNDTYNELIIEDDNDSYTAIVTATIFGKVAESTQKVNVGFTIGMEYRSWGIKSIDVKPIQISSFSVELSSDGGSNGSTIDIRLDIEQLRVKNFPPSGYIGVGGLEVYLDDDGHVDYNQSWMKVFGVPYEK